MSAKKFRIREVGSQKRPAEIAERLAKAGFVHAGPNPPDLFVAHISDALSAQDRSSLVGRGGVYVEYTGGGIAWRACDTRWFRGSDEELKARLDRLPPRHSSLEDLMYWLAPANDVLRCSYLRTLAVLCQGYLIVHKAV